MTPTKLQKRFFSTRLSENFSDGAVIRDSLLNWRSYIVTDLFILVLIWSNSPMVTTTHSCFHNSVLFSSIVWVLSRMLFRYSNSAVKRIYLLKMLRSQGIPPAKLHIIFRAIVVSRSLYCRPTPCLLGVLTDLVHSLAELMPFSSVHSDVAWLASSLLLMISCTGRPLGCLRKCVTQPIVSITSCHPSNLWIMFCVTVANPTSLPQCNYQSHKNSFINLCLFN